ncbi:amino acid adenylation domain-containing protein [Nonomuraea aurantiaca]|uniref:amino acid adenylation domain-containing protein n=1 Tax=Nonomuraea aurantiaca TaxID=2878562 RepID=UPI001CD919D8|nr:amino acid adenylation domain-containing protein [Nonomuraea aurantiaca]MCA2230001.1 amino acid adenylation domain-containing protein [Nonomuraea aurantiaca]
MTRPAGVHQLFELLARSHPQGIAVSAPEGDVSYAGLDEWGSRLAGRLAAAGVRPGERVGVAVERSPALIATLLGVLKAGAAYVPVDPADPALRLSQIIDDAGIAVALVDAEGAASMRPQPVHAIHVGETGDGARASVPVTKSDLAYLMYTSGSTGTPKAVMVEHSNIVNLVTEPNFLTITPDDVILQLAPAPFDAATFEIWGALLNGARLAIAPPGMLAPRDLTEVIKNSGVTVLWLTAALFHRQIDEDVTAFQDLRAVLAGGEALSASHVAALRAAAPDCRIVNGYGPTECTTFSSCHLVAVDERLGARVPIGTPVQNATAYVLGPDGTPLPPGFTGELHIGGAGVSRGYWRRPALTAERFVPDPFDPVPGRRLYRTGDLAAWTPEGLLDFRGRTDDQVKLRGHRVEPAEVENVLTAHPSVLQAAVALLRDDRNEPRLIAFVVPSGRFDQRVLRSFARQRLPAFMVPARFVERRELPVTGNGKIDRRALLTAFAG